jgi:hypothetical protein
MALKASRQPTSAIAKAGGCVSDAMQISYDVNSH